MAEEIVKVIKIDASSSSRSINQLKKELNELKKTLNSTQIGSKEYEAALKQLAVANRQYAAVMEDVKNRSMTTAQAFKSMNQLATGLTKAYSAISAGIGLISSDNEDLNKALLKVARTIQLIQGLSGFRDILVQVPKLVSWFKDLFKAIDPVERQIASLAKNISNVDTSKIQPVQQPTQQPTQAATTTVSAGGAAAVTREIQEQSKELDKQAKNYYPALINQRKSLVQQLASEQKLLKSQNKLLTDKLKVISKEADQYEEFIKVNTTLRDISSDLPKAFRAAGGDISKLQSELQKLGYTYEDILMYEKQAATTDFSKLDGQIKSLNEQLIPVRKNIEETNTKIGETKQRLGEVEAQMKQAGIATTALGRAAQTAGRLLKTAFISVGIGLLIAAVVKLGEVLVNIIKNIGNANAEIRKINLEIEKGTNQIVSKQIAILYELALAYKKVGESAEEKEKFLERYKDKIKETGIEISNVNRADDVFINNTKRYIEALTKRAKAQATENQAIKLYQEYLDKQAEIEDKIAKHRQATKDQFTALLEATGSTAEQAEQAWYTATDNTIKKLLAELERNEILINNKLQKIFKDVAEVDFEDILSEPKVEVEVEVETKVESKVQDTTERDLEMLAKFYKEAGDLFKDARTKELDDTRAKYEEQIELAKKYNKDTTLLEQARNAEIADILKKYRDQAEKDRQKAIEDELNGLQDSIERIRKMYATSNIREIREQTYQTTYKQPVVTTGLGLGSDWTNVYQSKKDIENQYNAQIEYNNKILELTKSRIEQENELLNKQLEIEGITADRREEIERTLAENLIAYQDAITANEQANLNAQIEMQQKRQQALNSTLTVTSNLMGAFASLYRTEMQDSSKSEKERIKAAKTYKALAITQATVDTYKSANEAYSAMASIPYVGPALGIAAAAAAIVAGLANVKSIISESNSVASSVSGSVSSVGSSVQAPITTQYPIEYTRNLIGDREVDEINKPMKVYVLESDITNAQNRVRVVENNASF